MLERVNQRKIVIVEELIMGAALDAGRATTDALEAQDWNRLYELLTDDFVFINPNSPMPEVEKDQWIGLSRIAAEAFSGFTYNFELLEEKGSQVWVGVEFEGTFDGELDLTPLGMGVIAPTGQHARANRSISVGTVNADGLVESIEVIDEGQGAGLFGLFAKVGIKMG
jgi:hypothetical protein